ncbi:MAG TPA: neutral zinc metallopeptidase [bacterium]|nr:neutral zinc metallopeptidase [bacterium]
MRWENQRESRHVEDRRGRPAVRGGIAIGGTGLLLVLVLSLLTGQNPLQLLGQLGGGAYETSTVDSGAPPGLPQDQLGRFASVVLANTEDTWNAQLPRMGRRYREPTLVLFSEAVQSACGLSSAAVGPFYCPADQKVYLDLSFFDELSRRFGAPGDFAQAYVIAHEVGHHVQTLLGISEQVSGLRQRVSRAEANELSVRQELQADCLAGVWGHWAQNQSGMIEPGDFEEGLRAAAAIGDDRLQRLGRGQVQPESFTHGTSEQRVSWLKRGLQSGDPKDCDTFAGPI